MKIRDDRTSITNTNDLQNRQRASYRTKKEIKPSKEGFKNQ